MDLVRSIIYRDFSLNDSTLQQGTGVGDGIDGCTVDSADISEVEVIQYREQKSQRDGKDAGDVHYGGRRIVIAGTLYGRTRGMFFDNLQRLKAALSPVLAQADEPADKGYQPLYFSVPTNRLDDYETGAIDLRILCMPITPLRYALSRDQLGGEDGDALAVPWQATLFARDPRIMAELPTEVTFVPTVNKSGNFNNRGDYLAALNMIFEVTGHSGTITVTAGGSNFTITIPTSVNNRIIRFKDDRVLTLEEEGVETLRRDLLAFQNDTSWPLIPGDTSPYAVSFSGGLVLVTGSMWFWESFA